jgi:hypothetical protein
MHLRIDGAGQHEKTGTAVLFARGRSTGANGLHLAIADQNVTVVDQAVGKDNRACKNPVSHRFSSSLGK